MKSQEVFCDNRFCDIRSFALEALMDASQLKRLMDERGVNQAEIARILGISADKVSKALSGKRRFTVPEADRLRIWAERNEGRPGALPDIPPTRGISPDDETVEILQLDLRFSMGPGTNIDDYIEETPARYSLDLIRSFTRTPPTRLRRASGVGDSMFPTLQSSDAVWIDTTQRMLNQQDRVWAISLYGAAAIKRLRTIGNGRVLVISDNPSVADQEVDAEDLIIGGRIIRLERDI